MITKDTVQNWVEQLSEKKSSGGVIPRSDKEIVYERSWVQCKKCGLIFESYTNPPICLGCLVYEDNK